MKLKEIRVNAGQTFNNPYESYANFKPSITLTYEVADGEQVSTEAIKSLQLEADRLCEEHKNKLLEDMRKAREKADYEGQVERLKRDLETAKGRIAEKEELLKQMESEGPKSLPYPIGHDYYDDDSSRRPY